MATRVRILTACAFVVALVASASAHAATAYDGAYTYLTSYDSTYDIAQPAPGAYTGETSTYDSAYMGSYTIEGYCTTMSEPVTGGTNWTTTCYCSQTVNYGDAYIGPQMICGVTTTFVADVTEPIAPGPIGCVPYPENPMLCQYPDGTCYYSDTGAYGPCTSTTEVEQCQAAYAGCLDCQATCEACGAESIDNMVQAAAQAALAEITAANLVNDENFAEYYDGTYDATYEDPAYAPTGDATPVYEQPSYAY